MSTNAPNFLYAYMFLGSNTSQTYVYTCAYISQEKSGGTVTAIRWITDRDTDEFKGAGYLEFSSVEVIIAPPEAKIA